MPPKPQVFKTPDGKEFSSRAEWRDYMMATFYTFKNKTNETCVKNPGEIDGQMFDIGDCTNSNLVLMDNCEQVQIDVVTNSRVFVGACASSIFIRNCSNCVFYTCCRQLRLREVTNCTFYIFSMAEVHIELSNNLQFAPFNGGYPDHAKHLRAANLDTSHNLWYDVFDHNDPGRTRVNWGLLPPSQYEPEGWFPAGPCERAVPVTSAGSVHRTDENAAGSSMQSFGMQQLMADAQAAAASSSPTKAKPVEAAAAVPAVPAPASSCCGAPQLPAADATASAATGASSGGEHQELLAAVSSFFAAESTQSLATVSQLLLLFHKFLSVLLCVARV
jgi:hypothetical protein